MRLDAKPILSLARVALIGLVTITEGCTGLGGPSTPGQAGAASPSSTPRPSEPGAIASGAPTPAATAPASVRPSPTGISEAQAIAAVQAFAPHTTGLQVTETDSVPMGPSYRVQSADVTAEVDEATGEVRMFIDNRAMPTSRTVTLTRDEAQAAATAWLAAHGVPTGGLSPTTTLQDHGESQEYAVVFAGRVNNARVPHTVSVSIDPATGVVYAFVLFTRPFVTPPAPTLTADQAIAAGRAEEQDPTATPTSTELAIAFDTAGTQILVYEVDLTRTDGFYVKLQVDAITGAVTVLGRG